MTSAGSGYTKAPYVYLIGGGGTGAQADALLTGAMVMTGKNLTEGFDMDYGRMDVLLGSTPNPLTPLVGLGPVVGLAHYVDPPTEILTPETPVLWRLSHIGVDSHAMHFHLFDVQVVNRVDWTGIIKPPQPSEIGWKDTVETDPFTDLIVALRPTAAAMKLPFGLPRSSRLLDPTMPAGSTANFTPVAPPAGVPAAAQLANVVTDFGWEYVWHCHLLGHEENDMMRAIVFDVPATVPTAPALSLASVGPVKLTWTDPTPYDYTTGQPASTLGNPMNEIGFRIMRGTGNNGALTQIGTALANQTAFTDTTAVAGTTYRYQVVIYNAAGSTPTNILLVSPPRITTTTLARGEVTVLYNQTLAGTGGITPYTWSVSAGALPGGLALDPATGVISGTPTTAGTFNFTVRLTDATLATATRALSIVIAPVPSITTASLPNGTVGMAYSRPLAATGGITPYSWSVSAGALPGGLTLNPTTGVISGTPTTAGTFSFTVRLRDALLATATQALSITVSLPPPPVVPSSFTVTAARANGNNDRATLTWTETPNTAASFTLQRASNSGFTSGRTTLTAAGNATSYQDNGVRRATTYWYRIQAVNAGGASAWCTPVSVTTP